MAGEILHEDRSVLSAQTLDRHRAIATLMEELEAIDWYDQRIEASSDTELAQILTHNREEEKEHASMLLEWLRRHDPGLDTQLRAQLFREGPIRDADQAHAGGDGGGSLGIGSLRERGA
jgi:ferritin-like protein